MTEPASHHEQSEYSCPYCGQSLGLIEPGQTVVTCPHCGQSVMLLADPDLPQAVAEPQGAQTETTADEELSALKIRQISDLRRGAYRTRSWLLIGAIACGVGAIQLIFLAFRGHRLGFRLAPLGDLLAAAVALALCLYFARRCAAAHREIQQSHLDEPHSPPDFSTLSNGSQYSDNLQKMSDSTFEQ